MIGALAALLALSLAAFALRAPEEPQSTAADATAPEEPGRPAAQQEGGVGEAVGNAGTTAEETPGRWECPLGDEGSREVEAGGLAPPPPREDDVPRYEILQEEPDATEGIKATTLLVDTQARDEDSYTLIARDIRSDYEDFDAVSVEFTDSTNVLSRNGSALILNTPCGSYYMGYTYGPRDDDGDRVFVTARD